MKELIVSILKTALKKKGVKLEEQEIEKFLEVPPSSEMGDYAFPCFFLAGKLKQSPHEIALEIREHIKDFPDDLEDIQTSGPYINFFVNRKALAKNIIKEILSEKEKFGKTNLGNRKNIVVEFSSPNIAKPFGVNHLRSTIIGNSISNICEFVNFQPIKINYLGDWGTQFGKIILGYDTFGNQTKLEKDPIRHLFEVYVKINKDKKYEEEARKVFKELEQGDKDVVRLWTTFRDLSVKYFKKIYKILGIDFDVYDEESMHNKEAEKILEILKTKKLLRKSQGAQIVSLKKYNLGVCLIEKTDGTTLYATRDIASAIDRYKKYKFTKMIYEVGQEQKLHFKQIFKILELIGYDWAKDCVHVSHGLYLGKKGKKLSTRKGETIFLEEVIDEAVALAKKQIKKRAPKISKEQLEKRALTIAISAIFYGDLKNNRANDMVFDIEKFVSFEGDTGPYILYSYARASSILRKSKQKGKNDLEINELHKKEIELIKKLSQFKEIVLNSYNHLNPSLIANYSYQLAKTFNEFYHVCPVIDSKQKAFRLELVDAVRQVLKNSLNLLGIETLEEM